MALLCFQPVRAQEAQWTSIADINPFIGTGGHGHTHPSAQAPFGMIQLGPNTRYDGWDGCSGYHFTDTALYGFTCTHLSGTGVSDYGDLLMLPYSEPTQEGQLVGFDKAKEVATAGYYRCVLDDGTQIEATASTRAGQLRILFPSRAEAGHWGERTPGMLVDLNFRDRVLGQDFTALGGGRYEGARISEGWAEEQHFYFAMQVLPPPDSVAKLSNGVYWMAFPEGTTAATVSVAMSGTSEEGAWRNFEAERPDRPFEAIQAETEQLWSGELAKTRIKSALARMRAIYATALYHAYSVPNVWSDVDGSYRGQDNKIYKDTVNRHYTVFSLWDTYRTAHPLYTVTQPERTQEFVYNFLDMYQQRGRLPIWELAGNETNCMIGYHSVSVLADAIAKGYATDTALTLEAMRATAESAVFGLDAYQEFGFLTIEDESESVSKTLEYSYDDACISWTAERLGQRNWFATHYAQRSSGYRSLIDPESGYVRPRTNGNFMEPYNPREVNNHFTEANAFQYSFTPVHDLEGWMALLTNYRATREGWNSLRPRKQSGRVKSRHDVLEDLLTSLFNASSHTTGREQADITGLMGQYAHGNEPSHHIAYLYNATNNPRLTSYWVHRILGEQYQNAPDGLSGNEDCGQMSAWYVMASMGLYPLVPGQPHYQLSTPFWDAMHLKLPNGKTLDIECEGVGTYILDYQRNDLALAPAQQPRFVTHEQLLEGGHWTVRRGDEASSWAVTQRYTTSMNNPSPPAPVIRVERTFTGETPVEVAALGSYEMLSLMESEGVRWRRKREGKPLSGTAYANGYVTAVVPHYGYGNHVARAFYTKRDDNLEASWVMGHPAAQYTAGGPMAMIDGLQGDTDWRKGHWVGVQGHDATLQVNLKQHRNLDRIEVGVLKDIRAWIALPERIEAQVRYKGDERWTALPPFTFEDPLSQQEAFRATASFPVDPLREVDQIQLQYINAGRLEDWHPGAGYQSYFFTDEVTLHEVEELE